jgi:hypothetical protein
MSTFRRPRSLWPITLIVLLIIWILTLVVLIHRGPRLQPWPAGAAAAVPPVTAVPQSPAPPH